MKKKLPNIYKGKVKQSQNQKQSILSKFKDYKEEDTIMNEEKDIFHSPNYVYKADVNITTLQGETIKKTIIGRTNNSLITIDDELIDVSKISKIDFLD